MTYPAGIAALTVKTDGPDQPILAAHPNALKTALDEFRAVIGDTPQGAVADLQTRLAVLLGTDGKLNDFGQIRVVGKDGCKYSTIQSAIDSITDASSSKPYSVLVLPGVYTENVTTKPYVSVVALSDLNPIFFDSTPLGFCEIDSVDGGSVLNLNGGLLSGFIVLESHNYSAVRLVNYSPQLKNVYVVSEGEASLFTRVASELYATNCGFRGGYGSEQLTLNGGIHRFERCHFLSYEDTGLFDLSGFSQIHAHYCEFNSGSGANVIAASQKLYARFCQFSVAPSGAGTIDLGTMNGTCCDSIPL